MKKRFFVVFVILPFLCFYGCGSASCLSESWKVQAAKKYSKPVFVDGINVISQDVSCGYAIMEMFSQWASLDAGGNGVPVVTEEALFSEYGKVVTSTGKKFEAEMNKRFPAFSSKLYKNLSPEEFIDKAYCSLAHGIPVPFEWAAKLGDEWTLHYSLLVGIDFPHNNVKVLNPYGYEEILSIDDFLLRTSFEAFENMPFIFKMGFVFGVFEKNALVICQKKMNL